MGEFSAPIETFNLVLKEIKAALEAAGVPTFARPRSFCWLSRPVAPLSLVLISLTERERALLKDEKLFWHGFIAWLFADVRLPHHRGPKRDQRHGRRLREHEEEELADRRRPRGHRVPPPGLCRLRGGGAQPDQHEHRLGANGRATGECAAKNKQQRFCGARAYRIFGWVNIVRVYQDLVRRHQHAF